MVESQKHCAEQMKLDWLKWKNGAGRGMDCKLFEAIRGQRSQDHKIVKNKSWDLQEKITKLIASGRATIILCALERNVY